MYNTKKQKRLTDAKYIISIDGELKKQLGRLSETAIAELICVIQAERMQNRVEWIRACGFKES
jgi:hypothetical protein